MDRGLAHARVLIVVLLAAALGLAAVTASGCGGPGGSAAQGGGGGAGGGTGSGSSGGSTPTRSPSPKPSTSTPATPALRVVFVDVGQGDAAALRSGAWTGLVDGGPSGSQAAVEAALAKLGVRRLDTLVISHLHADHTGGLPALVRRYRPRRAWVAGAVTGSLAAALRGAGTVVKQARRGLTARFGRAKASVLAPGGLSGDANTDSIVLLLQAGGRRVVFTGDSTGGGRPRRAPAWPAARRSTSSRSRTTAPARPPPRASSATPGRGSPSSASAPTPTATRPTRPCSACAAAARACSARRRAARSRSP